MEINNILQWVAIGMNLFIGLLTMYYLRRRIKRFKDQEDQKKELMELAEFEQKQEEREIEAINHPKGPWG